MSTTTSPARRRGVAAIAGVIGVAGLLASGVFAAWVAGSLGISTAAASQVVTAIEVGGAALTAIGVIFGAGIVGAIIGTVRYLLVKQARRVVVL